MSIGKENDYLLIELFVKVVDWFIDKLFSFAKVVAVTSSSSSPSPSSFSSSSFVQNNIAHLLHASRNTKTKQRKASKIL